jgi:uncharacterized protein YcaQ
MQRTGCTCYHLMCTFAQTERATKTERMFVVPLNISKINQRRFILGKQGLYPGRRWQGKEGVCEALRAGCVVQVDPLSVVAQSQDIVLYGRVLDYKPALLRQALYTDRLLFEYGGAVMILPMEELPYWRVAMARKRLEPRRAEFAAAYANLVEQVYSRIAERGPLSARDFESKEIFQTGQTKGSFRSSKAVNQALYYLWLAGEIMTHSRKGLERVYDLRERIAPAQFAHTASEEEAEAFFELEVLRAYGMLSARSWRLAFAGDALRSVEKAEAAARLTRLVKEGKIVQVALQDDAKTEYFVRTEDFPLLEKLHAGEVPDEWQPLEASTREEMIFLAPLEIVSARGRAMSLFDFEYLWEVYKPQEKRRWGYYTLPILYQDTLVARTDLKLERDTNTLVVKGFWLENHIAANDAFITALTRAFKRFMQFVEARQLDSTGLSPTPLREKVERLLNTA